MIGVCWICGVWMIEPAFAAVFIIITLGWILYTIEIEHPRMKPELDKRDAEMEPKVLTLGRGSRTPLSSLQPPNSVPLSQLTKISPSPLNANLASLPSVFPKLPHPLTHPFRIISQHIGIPFEIRISTSEINYLQKEIRELRLKCQELESQHQQRCESSQSRQSRDKDIESTFLEISKSTKNIEQHLGSVISGQCELGKGGEERDVSQIGEKQSELIIRQLERKSERIEELQTKNKSLEFALMEAQAHLQKLFQENELLRRQIANGKN